MCVLIPPALRPLIYDLTVGALDRAGFARVRRQVAGQAHGATLEVGAGTGRNLRYYGPRVGRLVVSDPDRHSVQRLRRRAGRLHRPVEVVAAAAESLPFDDDTFDTVIVTLVLCTVPDPAAALGEIRRVLRPGGRLVFAEHVKSTDAKIAARQVRWRPTWGHVAGGCDPARDTARAIVHAGFTMLERHDGSLPIGPSITRPLIAGIASPNAAGGADTPG